MSETFTDFCKSNSCKYCEVAQIIIRKGGFCEETFMQMHDARVRAETIEKFAHALKGTFNNEFPSNYHCTKPYFTLDNVRVLVDLVAKEQSNG